MAVKRTKKRTVREKEHPKAAPKNTLMRRKDEDVLPLPKKAKKKRAKKKTRVRHLFKKGEPHGSRTY